MSEACRRTSPLWGKRDAALRRETSSLTGEAFALHQKDTVSDIKNWKFEYGR